MNHELDRLETAKQCCLTSLEQSFNQIADVMRSTHEALMRSVDEASQTKRKVLEEQITLIRQETDKVSSSFSLPFSCT